MAHTELENLRNVQLSNKKALLDNIASYKQSVIEVAARKVKTQKEFGSFWKMQMGWNESKIADQKSEP